MEDLTRQKIYLAALLHDIGKFYQRADSKKSNGNFVFLKPDFWNKPEVYCPVYKSNYSHKHVLWTAQFIQEQSDVFNALGINAKDGENSLTLLAASHHNPGSNMLAQIIQKADWYSSGADRSNESYVLDDGLDETKWDLFRKRRMVSIFEGVRNETNRSKYDDYKFGLPVDDIQLNKASFFPKKHDEFPDNTDYTDLWKRFLIDFEKLPTTNAVFFLETLLYLLQKYTVTIPSSTNHLPDVSLYDHAKTTAAFAVCIYDFYIENGKLPSSTDKVIQFVGADISGIQKFIYDIVSKNAAKNLKGRSFYLKLMADNILRYIIRELNLFAANIVYSSGGGFYVLASNTKDFIKSFQEIVNTISENLFAEHKTTLFVALASVEVEEKEILNSGTSIKDKWTEIIQKLNEKKRQRYSDKLIDNYADFFEPIEKGGENKENRDSITGEELTKKEIATLEDNITIVSKDTKRQIQLGKDLKNAEYWIIAPKDSKKIDDVNWYDPLKLGFYNQFLTETQFESLASIPDNCLILTINQADFTPMHQKAKYAVGFTFYGGNEFPAYEKNEIDTNGDKHFKGEPLSFDKLVGEGKFKRLGILRMDVDNLGQIFMNGFSENKRTFSRYSSLSRNLDFYFTGYLNKIQQQDKYKDLTYILYSGGDDLFILGKWNLLIDMAKEIQNDFAVWTCQNSNVSLSGGIAIVNPKCPIMKGADLAAYEEKSAKNYKNGKFEKNAFSLMGFALSWENEMEFEMVLDLKTRFLKMLKEEKLPKSLIGSIAAFNEQRKHQIKKEKNESWQWVMAYQLARFAQRQKDVDVEKLIDEIKLSVFTNTYHKTRHQFKYEFIELLNLAARWAELEYRTEN